VILALEKAATALRDCSHNSAIAYAEGVKRCPHCGAMRTRSLPWAQPHLVTELVRAIPTETK
jgi:DNA-binding helix-hairpin-helix protein with protein kinase domain